MLLPQPSNQPDVAVWMQTLLLLLFLLLSASEIGNKASLYKPIVVSLSGQWASLILF